MTTYKGVEIDLFGKGITNCDAIIGIGGMSNE